MQPTAAHTLNLISHRGKTNSPLVSTPPQTNEPEFWLILLKTKVSDALWVLGGPEPAGGHG